MSTDYVLAHDLGTTGNKAVLYDGDGNLVADAMSPYETHYAGGGRVEQSADDWWVAVCRSTREVIGRAAARVEDVRAVSFSAQMMGCLPVDAAGEPLRNAIIWADTRSGEQAGRLAEAIGGAEVYRITGHRLSSSYSAAKLMWIRDNEPDVYRRTCKMVQAKDFVVHRLTGVFLTDYSDACGTNLFDLQSKQWSEDILEAAGLPLHILPDAVPSTTIAGRLLTERAAEVGLAPGTPIVVGGGDGACATVGAGVVESGKMYNVLGTSSWIAGASKEPHFDPEQRTFNWVHLDAELYNPCGTMQGAGFSYSWFREVLGESDALAAKQSGVSIYELLNEYAESSPVGANGLLFLPYLMGERSPWWNPKARAAFIGLDAAHTRKDMVRAVLEGVALNLKIILDVFEAVEPVDALVLIGGGARNRVWRKILASAWNRPLDVPGSVENATSMGAAVCGGVAVGMYPGFDVATRFARSVDRVEPEGQAAEDYERLYPVFCNVYRALVPAFDELAEFRRQRTEQKR